MGSSQCFKRREFIVTLAKAALGVALSGCTLSEHIRPQNDSKEGRYSYSPGKFQELMTATLSKWGIANPEREAQAMINSTGLHDAVVFKKDGLFHILTRRDNIVLLNVVGVPYSLASFFTYDGDKIARHLEQVLPEIDDPGDGSDLAKYIVVCMLLQPYFSKRLVRESIPTYVEPYDATRQRVTYTTISKTELVKEPFEKVEVKYKYRGFEPENIFKKELKEELNLR